MTTPSDLPDQKRPSEPSYYPQTVYAEDGEGGYRSSGDLDVCSLCGAFVGDRDRHDEWHVALANGPEVAP